MTGLVEVVLGKKRGIKSAKRKERETIPMIRTALANQVSLLTTRYTPAMNAKDIIERANPNSGRANLREVRIKLRSPNCAQMRETATINEVYIAMVLQITNIWNLLLFSIIAMPWFGSELS